MKRILAITAVALALFAIGARADSYSYSITVTNAQAITYSDPLPVSGWLDKIEVVTDADSTQTVTVATYNGTTAVDTYATKAISGASKTATVFRPRLIGTSNAGVAIAGAGTTNEFNIAATTALVAAYERPMIGGNVKCAVTGTANDGSATVAVTIYYEPLKK